MGNSTTILLVDDDLDCRTIFSRALSYAGYRVMDAATGARAIDIARTVGPAICIVDIGLPDLDGLAVTRALRENPSTQNAFIIILTAYVSDFDRVQARQAGCDLYVGKPILPRDLVAIIDSASRDLEPTATTPESPASPEPALSQSPPKHPAEV